MPMLGVIESLAAREIERAIRPLARRVNRGRRSHAIEAGAVDEETVARAASEWWGAEAPWYRDDSPPRRRNHITPLIDGESYLAALVEELNAARRYVFVAGWCLTPHMPLLRDGRESLETSQVMALLMDVARRIPVRILLWSGAPFVIQPTVRATREVKRVIDDEARRLGVDLVCELDSTAHVSHCHHQKTVVIDGRVAFVGGMDITTFQGDRWDESRHPLRAGLNWHDVQTKIEGETVADVERNFRQRWADTAATPLPEPGEPVVTPAMTTPAQIIRTIPPQTYDFAPNGIFGIHHALIDLIRGAKRLIYLENQYLWSPEVVEALTEVIERPDGDETRIIIVLPARAYSGKWDNDRRVAALRKADRGRRRFEAYCLYASGPHLGVRPFRYRPIYVHAKVSVIDDEWVSIGSANLNTRGLVTDSELNVLAHDAELAKRVRVSLWAEHLAMAEDDVAAADPRDLLDGVWAAQAAVNAGIVKRGDGPLHGGLHRYELGRMPGAFLLEEVESLTFEH